MIYQPDIHVLQRVIVTAILTLISAAATAQTATPTQLLLTEPIETLAKCDVPKATVQLIENSTPEGIAKLEEFGISQAVTSLVQELLAKSGCYLVKADAPQKLRIAVTNILRYRTMMGRILVMQSQGDEWIVNVDVVITLEGGVKPVSANARGQTSVQLLATFYSVSTIDKRIYPSPLDKARSHSVALAIALESALSKLVAQKP